MGFAVCFPPGSKGLGYIPPGRFLPPQFPLKLGKAAPGGYSEPQHACESIRFHGIYVFNLRIQNHPYFYLRPV